MNSKRGFEYFVLGACVVLGSGCAPFIHKDPFESRWQEELRSVFEIGEVYGETIDRSEEYGD
tara:strand:- start:66 stop:251 length:186 start_codon:yes stop_codon:yes gene_type:complete